ncbi:hypothetical protein P9112_007905 [Eukaryota sp. TZLM1-RC]
MFNNFFHDPFDSHFSRDRHRSSQRNRHQSPVVEELDDNEQSHQHSSHQNVEVEHPDDPSTDRDRYRHVGNRADRPRRGPSDRLGFGFGSLFDSSMFDMDFGDFTNPNSGNHQVFYSKTVSHSSGPGGVKHTSTAVHDSRTGKQTFEESRTIGDKTMRYYRERDRDGHDNVTTRMENVEDAEAFDRDWSDRSRRLLGYSERFRDRNLPRSLNSKDRSNKRLK